MTNVPVYMVVNLKINDPDQYRIYEKGFFPFLKKHNGSFITFDDSPECLEGKKPMQFDRVIIFSFASEKDASFSDANEKMITLSNCIGFLPSRHSGESSNVINDPLCFFRNGKKPFSYILYWSGSFIFRLTTI